MLFASLALLIFACVAGTIFVTIKIVDQTAENSRVVQNIPVKKDFDSLPVSEVARAKKTYTDKLAVINPHKSAAKFSAEARNLFMRRHYAEAHALLVKAMQEIVADGRKGIRDPSDRQLLSDLYYRISLCLFEQHNYLAAEAHLKEAIRIFPTEPAYYKTAGMIHRAMGKTEEAAKDHAKWVELTNL